MRCIIALVVLIGSAAAQSGRWQQLADPASAGWDGVRLAQARKLAERMGSAAFLVVDRGHVVVAWGDVTRRYKCHSVRKSVLSALFGVAVARGKVDLDETVGDLGIDDKSPLSAVEKRARLVHLLQARSGIYHPAAKETKGMRAERPKRGSRKPGAGFFYNNWDFNVLGVALERKTGKTLFEAFDAWLAKPLGMEDWRLSDGRYELEPGRSVHPAYAFRLSARDLARLGLLFARGGSWAGRQVVPRAWIEESTKRHTNFSGGRGYGYMWWIYPKGSMEKYPRLNAHDTFAASGTGGQLVLVVPQADFVVVHRGDTDNNLHVRGGDIWGMAEKLLAARPAEPAEDPDLGPLTPTPLPGAKPAPTERVAVALDAATLGDYVGEYKSLMGTASVFEYDGRLFVRSPDEEEAELFGEAKDRFFLRKADVQIAFERGPDARVSGAKMTWYGREVRSKKVK